MAKTGRPTIYDDDLAINILRRISLGESLRTICKDEEMPNRDTVYNWVLDKTKIFCQLDESGKEVKLNFSDQYEKAVNNRAEMLFDEIEEIADNKTGEVARDRLRVDTRKWYLSKVLPKKFGEKMDLTSDGEKIQGNTIIFKEFKKDATDSE